MTNKELWEYSLGKTFEKHVKAIEKQVQEICESSPDKFRALEICKTFLKDEMDKLKLKGTLQ